MMQCPSGHTTVYDAISRQLIVLGGMVPDALFQSKRSSDLLAYNIDKTVSSVILKNVTSNLDFESQLNAFYTSCKLNA